MTPPRAAIGAVAIVLGCTLFAPLAVARADTLDTDEAEPELGSNATEEPIAGAAETAPPPGAGWRTVLERAVDASKASAFEGRLVIIAFGRRGPTLAEVDVAQGTGGGLRVGQAETWMVGRKDDEAFFWQPQAGTLLRIGNVERTEFSIPRLIDNYEVRRVGGETLRTGDAIVLALRAKGAEHDRERLYVDEATGLVVRRETFADDGSPQRLVAFTALEVSELAIATPEAADPLDRGSFRAVSPEGLDILARVGWAVPSELDGGFTLMAGYALPESDGSSLHLVYTDGLYTLSIYEQFGRLDRDATTGADVVERDEVHVWRWPGSEPERLVWTGDGKTFTAISDGPLDVVLRAVGAFPSDPALNLPHRLARGISRVASWLWPFG